MDNGEGLSPVATTTAAGIKRRPGPAKDEHPARRHFLFNSETDTSICVMERCTHSQQGDKVANLMRHLKHDHYELWSIVDGERKEQARKRKQPCPDPVGNLYVKMNAELLKDACATLVTVDARPFTCVEDQGFRMIVEPILRALPAEDKFALSHESVRDLIRPKADKIRAKLKEDLKGKVLSLKVDGVSRLNRCFLGVNVQYIENGKICIRTLGVPELKEQHSGKNLSEVIVDVLKGYDIELSRIYTSTTDNGSNMLKVGDLLKQMQEAQELDENAVEIDMELPHILDLDFVLLDDDEISEVNKQNLTTVSCAAHVLQLAVGDFLAKAEAKALIEKAKKLVKKLRDQSNVAELRRRGVLLPLNDVCTRWHSTHDMLNSLKRIKHVAKDMCPDILEEEDWDLLEELVEVLLPARIATKVFEMEQLLAGDFLGRWRKMKADVRKSTSRFSEQFLQCLEGREQVPVKSRKKNIVTLFDNEAFLAAVFLDPRYFLLLTKMKMKDGGSAMSHAQESLRKLWMMMNDVNDETDVAHVAGEDEEDGEGQEDEELDELELELRELDRERTVVPETPNERLTRLNDELIDFMARAPRIEDKKTNIIEWWENVGVRKWPILSSLSKVALAVPMTQVSVERLFSALKFAFAKNRSRLLPEVLQDILLIRAKTIYEGRTTGTHPLRVRRTERRSTNNNNNNNNNIILDDDDLDIDIDLSSGSSSLSLISSSSPVGILTSSTPG